MKPDLSTKFDRHPELCHGDKSALQVSGNTVIRKREPTNLHTASKNVNMVFDHSKQFALLPDGKPKVLVEATNSTRGEHNYRTMNRSGRPYALGTMVGGSPDDPGTPLQSSEPFKMIKG